MPTTKHFAICPNGQKVTRNSQSRVYSHVVVYLPSYDQYFEDADQAGSFKHVESNFKYYMAYLDGTSKFLVRRSWQTDEQYEAQVKLDIERARKALGGATTLDEYREVVRTTALENFERRKAENFFNTFKVAGWSSRLDLAHKVAAQHIGGHYTETRILKAQII